MKSYTERDVRDAIFIVWLLMEWKVYAIIKIKDTKEHSPEQISTNKTMMTMMMAMSQYVWSLSSFVKNIFEILIEEYSDSRKNRQWHTTKPFCLALTNGGLVNFYIVF